MTFEIFVQKFPELSPPITLNEENAVEFSRGNEPLPAKLVAEHLTPIEPESDEFTEFVGCFRLPNLKDFHALVYWRAGLMDYQYILATFTKGGKLLDRRVLAGLVSDGKNIARSVAQIDSDNSITILSGFQKGDDTLYKAANSTTLDLELLPDGRIVELV